MLHYTADTGGRLFAQGRASSSCEARRNRVASSPKRAVKWTPTGRPSSFQCSGTDMPGWPVKMSGSHVKVEASPLLGADNADVYGEWLGLSKGDLDQLKKDGVV